LFDLNSLLEFVLAGDNADQVAPGRVRLDQEFWFLSICLCLSLFDLDALQRCDPERQQFVIFVV